MNRNSHLILVIKVPRALRLDYVIIDRLIRLFVQVNTRQIKCLIRETETASKFAYVKKTAP